jgi:Fe-S oxidoreductase
MDIPAAATEDGREVLLWVGCSGAFDPRGQQSVKAIAQLLKIAGVKFSILGPKERCTGDPARRTGDEFLFQQLAEANVATLNEVGATKIVTGCPHCMHTLKNEYPQFGGRFEVMHHTQYLAMLAAEGRIPISEKMAGAITYHDPCFLGRINGVTEEPRQLLTLSSTVPLAEAPRRESRSFCCGAGGGRMWMEDAPSERPGIIRAKELAETKAERVAVGCPFCKVMVGDCMAHAVGETAPEVVDIAEVLLAAAGGALKDAHPEPLREGEEPKE